MATALLLSSTTGCLYFNVTTPLDDNLDETTLGAKTRAEITVVSRTTRAPFRSSTALVATVEA